MSYEIELATISVLSAIELAAANGVGGEFDESKVNRDKGGKFAKKNVTLNALEPSPEPVNKGTEVLIQQVLIISAAGAAGIEKIAENQDKPGVKQAVKSAVAAYDKEVKTSAVDPNYADNPAKSFAKDYLAIDRATRSISKAILDIKDYALVEKEFPDGSDPSKTVRKTQLQKDIQSLKEKLGRTVAGVAALLDPKALANRMTETKEWLKTRADNTFEGASKFIGELLKSAGERLSGMPDKGSANEPAATPVAATPKPVETNPPAKLAKSQIEAVVGFSKAVSEGFVAAAHSELAMQTVKLAQNNVNGVSALANKQIGKISKQLSEVDYKGGMEVAGKKIKEIATTGIENISTLADEIVVAQDFGKSGLDKLDIIKGNPSKVDPTMEKLEFKKAPQKMDEALADLGDYSSRVGRAIFNVVTSKTAETVGKIPQQLTKEDTRADILPPAATGLDRVKKKMGLPYNSPKAKTPLGQLGRNIDNSLRQKGQKLVDAIDQYSKDVDRNKPLIRQDLGIPSLRDLVMTDDINTVLNFKDRAEQLLKGIKKTNQDRYSEADRQQDLEILKLEGMRRLQNLSQIITRDAQQAAIDYQTAARKRLEAKQAAQQNQS